jgi:MFS family permease
MTRTSSDNTVQAAPLPAAGLERARARPGVLLAIVLTGQFMALVDASIVNVAIAAIHTSLRASGASLQLVIGGYTIAYAVLLVTGARLGDILGHRRMFLAGLTVFTLASLGCGLAPTVGSLIALRFIQGAGAAAMIPQVLSLIQRTFTGAARTRAMSRYSAVLAGGAVVGQVVGGLLISADLLGSTWRPVFLVNVPVGIVLAVAGARYLPASRGDEARLDRSRLDLVGLVMLACAVFALVLPLVLGQSEHWPTWGWALLAASPVLLVVFALAERRLAAAGGKPIVPGRVLRLPGFGLAITGVFLTMTMFGGFFFSFALQLQSGLGDSPLRAGLTFAPAAATFGFVSLTWRRLPPRSHEGLIIAGFAACAVSLLAMAETVRGGGSGGTEVYVLNALFGAGMAAAYSPLLTRTLLRVPIADAADATGVIVTVVQFALVLGVATFGTIYLNLAGALPAVPGNPVFRMLSAHADAVTCVALAAAALGGAAVALARQASSSRAAGPADVPQPVGSSRGAQQRPGSTPPTMAE